jgi:Family of unknown function (DUF5519)
MGVSISDRLRQTIAELDGVTESESMFKDAAAYWVNGKEIAHFEGDDVIDIRLTRAAIRARRAQLRADERVELRSSSSDWLAVRITEPGDVAFAAQLAESAAAAHRAPAGTAPEPPPSGGQLARRKRFH